MIFYKIYERRNGILVAACDEDICGKTLKSGEIEFHVNPRFYKDKKASKEELIKLLRSTMSVNLVGKDAVDCGVRAGLVSKDNIIKIKGVPHAQAVVMDI